MFLIWFPLAYTLVAAEPDTFCDQNTLRCYSFNPEPLSYSAANYHCNSLHGQLASIENESESDLLAGIAAAVFSNSSSNDYWIGANYFLDKWSWVDGSDWYFINWDTGEPRLRTCASVRTTTGKWMTTEPEEKKPFTCSVPAVVEPECEDGWTINRETMSCYYLVWDVKFADAEQKCAKQGAHLASIHSSAENDFVLDLTSGGYITNSQDRETYIGGLFYNGNAQQWQWTDGTETDFSNWKEGEPSRGVNEDCVQLYSDHIESNDDILGFWNDYLCSSRERIGLCKKPATMTLKID